MTHLHTVSGVGLYLVDLPALGEGCQQLEQLLRVAAITKGRQQSALHQLVVEVRHVQLSQAARRLRDVARYHVPATHSEWLIRPPWKTCKTIASIIAAARKGCAGREECALG